MSHNNTPPTRARNDRKRFEMQNPGHRTWECRGCGKLEHGAVPPFRWYRLTRCSGDPDLGPARMGECCSVACLRKHLEGVVAEQENNTPIFRPSRGR